MAIHCRAVKNSLRGTIIYNNYRRGSMEVEKKIVSVNFFLSNVTSMICFSCPKSMFFADKIVLNIKKYVVPYAN
jgi:hypothetical protein